MCILAKTRPEWTYADFAVTSIGAIEVPIYPTNSAEECEWVAPTPRRARSSARTPPSWTRSRRSAHGCPHLRHLIVIEPSGEESRREIAALHAIPQELRTRGAAQLAELAERYEAVGQRIRTRSSTPPGPPARPRAACCRTATTAICSTCRTARLRRDAARRSTCTCPCPLLRAADPAAVVRPRRHARLLGRRHQADRRRAAGGPADLLALGAAYLREDLHARHRRDRKGDRRGAQRKRAVRGRHAGARTAARAASRSPTICRRRSKRPRRQLYKNVRALFGGNLRQASAARRRSHARSSSSSTPAACPCSRATG